MESPEKPACRHEYVRIYQRKLKGLERRLVATKAWLPVGFKQTDFSHLSEGSYCFCSNCRARLYPKRTAAEKLEARQALAASKLLLAEQAEQAEQDALDALEAEAIDGVEDSGKTKGDIDVEELEVESVELEDLEGASVGVPDTQDCQATADD
jgi:hypothetical protein